MDKKRRKDCRLKVVLRNCQDKIISAIPAILRTSCVCVCAGGLGIFPLSAAAAEVASRAGARGVGKCWDWL